MISNSKQQSLNAKEMLENNLKAYFLIGVEPELDSSLGLQVRESFLKANLVVAITAFESNLLLKYANLLLPMAVPQESGGSYINATGMLQTFDPIVKSSAEIKPLINIFMELAECFNLDISDFNLPEILQNVKQAKELVKPTNFNIQDCFTGQLSMAISNCELEAGLIFVPTISLYAVDAIVRRSVCLQQTKDAKIMITINPIDAKKLNIAFSENVTMKTSANLANHVNRFSFKLNINERVPKGCIWVNQVNNKTLLGIPYSKLVIEKTQVKVHD
jgi:NADH-quinone oxidoreductase subunit G